MRVLKWSGLVLALVLGVWLGLPLLEVATTPGGVPQTDQFSALRSRAEALVDTQWWRLDSVPTSEDLAEYQTLIAATAKSGLPATAPAIKEGFEAQTTARAEYDVRFSRYMRFYLSLQHWVDNSTAEVATGLVFGPSLTAAAYHHDRILERAHALRAPSRLLSELRYQYAMALIFADDKPGAVLQLRAIIKEDPDYALVNATYIIGGRADALEDTDFCKEFAAIGGDLERLRTDYVGSKDRLLFPIITDRSIADYLPR